MDAKNCSKCLSVLSVDMFTHEKNGYIRNTCNPCRLKQTIERRNAKSQMPKVIPATKSCIICEQVKKNIDFYKDSLSNDGLSKKCAECSRKTRHIKKDQPSITLIDLTCNKCLITKKSSEFIPTKKSLTGFFKVCKSCWKPREWNSEKQKAAEKKYVLNNPEKLREKWRKAASKPHRIIRDRLNHRISDALHSVKHYKSNKTHIYTGCSMDYLKKWFEYQFNDKIGWHNYGDWHIDHVLPCSKFDLTNIEDQKKCFSWKNLRPCLKEENMVKGDKIIKELVEQQSNLVLKFLEVNPLPTLSGDSVEGAE